MYLWSTLVFLLVLMVYIGFLACTYGLHWFSCLYLWSTLVLLVLMVYIGFLACTYGLHWFSCLFMLCLWSFFILCLWSTLVFLLVCHFRLTNFLFVRAN